MTFSKGILIQGNVDSGFIEAFQAKVARNKVYEKEHLEAALFGYTKPQHPFDCEFCYPIWKDDLDG